MYTDCLEAIKKQRGWNSEKVEWLFNYDGPMSAAVDDWLVDFLEEHGFSVAS